MIKEKKAEMVWSNVVTIFLLLFVAGTMIWLFLGPSKAYGGQISSSLIKAHNRNCLTGDFFDQLRESEDIYDEDVPGGDGMPDRCDVCLGGDTTDFDKDGIPDECDEEEENSAVTKCKNGIRRKDAEKKFYCCADETTYNIGSDRKTECEKIGLFG